MWDTSFSKRKQLDGKLEQDLFSIHCIHTFARKSKSFSPHICQYPKGGTQMPIQKKKRVFEAKISNSKTYRSWNKSFRSFKKEKHTYLFPEYCHSDQYWMVTDILLIVLSCWVRRVKKPFIWLGRKANPWSISGTTCKEVSQQKNLIHLAKL